MIEGQVYVNISPPVAGRGAVGGVASSGSRPRSRSYDRNLDKSPSPRLGSLERMLSCPMRLSEGAASAPPAPPRVTSFAEIARSKRRNGGAGGSPSLKAATDPFSSTYSTHSHSSVDFSPILEQNVEGDSHSLSPAPFTRCYSQGSIERHLEGARETRAKAEGTAPPPLILESVGLLFLSVLRGYNFYTSYSFVYRMDEEKKFQHNRCPPPLKVLVTVSASSCIFGYPADLKQHQALIRSAPTPEKIVSIASGPL